MTSMTAADSLRRAADLLAEGGWEAAQIEAAREAARSSG